MSGLREAGIPRPETEMEAFLRRNEVTQWQAYQLGAGEPCPHCGTTRRTASEPAGTGGHGYGGVITRDNGYLGPLTGEG